MCAQSSTTNVYDDDDDDGDDDGDDSGGGEHDCDSNDDDDNGEEESKTESQICFKRRLSSISALIRYKLWMPLYISARWKSQRVHCEFLQSRLCWLDGGSLDGAIITVWGPL